MKRNLQRLLTIVAALGLVMFVGVAYAKTKKPSKHHDAHTLTKAKLKTDGVHETTRTASTRSPPRSRTARSPACTSSTTPKATSR